MVEPDNNHESLLKQEQEDHLHLQTVHLGSFPLLLGIAALLGVLVVFGGCAYLVGRWLGAWS